MAFLQIFRAEDRVWMTQSPLGGGPGSPAWDFQWFISDPQVGQRYQLRMRAAYVPLDDPANLDAAREVWEAATEEEREARS